MEQEGCKYLERGQNGMQEILKFPEKPEEEEGIKNEEKIKREVKEILSGILQEYLVKHPATVQES